MRLTLRLKLIISAIALFLLTGCEISLAQDITPPPNYRRVSVEQSFVDVEETEAPVEQSESTDIDELTRPSTTEEVTQIPEGVESSTEEVDVESGTITGTVTNGSGGDLPAELEVSLIELLEMEPSEVGSTTTQTDGSFLFEDVEFLEGKIFLATVKFEQMTYSGFGFTEEDVTSLAIPITVYETTTDVSELVIEEMQIGIEFPDADTVNILQRYIVHNPGNKTIITANDNTPLLSIPIPTTATNWEFLGEYTAGHLVLTPEGDMDALLPGSSGYELFIAYDLPYDREMTYEQDLGWPVEALFIFLPQGDLELISSNLFEVGIDEVGETQYQVYATQGSLASGEVQFEIRGRNPMDTSGFLGLNIDNGLVVGASALLISLVIVGYFTRVRRGTGNTSSKTSTNKDTPEALMDKIIDLDEAFEAGDLAEDKYLENRAALKEQLRAVLD
ncbi:MAG: hypothetical protein FVQ83_08375 [Chloroflexi bacterium]|nr:hypothetical protein [Chloroflexota bacterium]